MEDEESKPCQNCKREIPSVNHLVHSMHCARNIKVCPVCKEPVPQGDLQEHHETMHKMLPCKFCGESVCGTDLEDHIRDSCGHTVQACRYCSLELARRSLPAHEGYCGARTEHCEDCGAWVMAKYRHIHRESNHGFLKLDDEPDPTPKNVATKPNNLNRPQSLSEMHRPKRPNAFTNATSPNFPKTVIGNIRPANVPPHRNEATTSSDTVDATAFTEPTPAPTDSEPSISHFNQPSGSFNQPSGSFNQPSGSFNQPWPVLEQPSSSWPVVAKRNNDQPQLNTNRNKNKDNPKSRGAVKKRTAPKPPKSPPRCVADLVYQSARSSQEEGAMPTQNPRKLEAYRLSQSESLQNGLEGPSRRNINSDTSFPDNPIIPNDQGPKNHRFNGPRNLGHGFNGRRNVGTGDRARNLQRRNDFKDLKPMSHQEFMERFQELQIQSDALAERNGTKDRVSVGAAGTVGAGGDRFSEIKSSLRELRRGLNEVTAPYNASNNSPGSPLGAAAVVEPLNEAAGAVGALGGDVVLPCEFCAAAVPPHLLIDHQVLCRPELTADDFSGADEEPLIPCEFCTEPLPLRRLADHQERCQRETNMLFNE